MASIWRHPNSKFYMACYTNEAGRQVKKTTKQVDKNKAMEIALELEHTAMLARQGVLTEAKCREILSGMLERTTGTGIRHTPTRTFLKTWLEGKKAAKSEGTAERYENTVKLFLKFLGPRADRPLIAITATDIQGFVNMRVRDGSAPKTVVVDAKTLNNVFNLARRQGLIPNNPVEAIELPTVESSERDVFTPTQVKLLVEEVSVLAARARWYLLENPIAYFTLQIRFPQVRQICQIPDEFHNEVIPHHTKVNCEVQLWESRKEIYGFRQNDFSPHYPADFV